MKEYKTASYKTAGTWDLPLLIDKIIEICTAQWMWDAEQAADWLEKKYKNPINPDIRDKVIQEAQQRIDQTDRPSRTSHNERHKDIYDRINKNERI